MIQQDERFLSLFSEISEEGENPEQDAFISLLEYIADRLDQIELNTRGGWEEASHPRGVQQGAQKPSPEKAPQRLVEDSIGARKTENPRKRGKTPPSPREKVSTAVARESSRPARHFRDETPRPLPHDSSPQKKETTASQKSSRAVSQVALPMGPGPRVASPPSPPPDTSDGMATPVQTKSQEALETKRQEELAKSTSHSLVDAFRKNLATWDGSLSGEHTEIEDAAGVAVAGPLWGAVQEIKEVVERFGEDENSLLGTLKKTVADKTGVTAANAWVGEKKDALRNRLMKWAGGDPATAFAEHENKRKGESIFSIIRDMDRLTTDIDMFNHTMTFVFQEKDREAVLRLASSLPETWLVKEKDEESDEEYEHEVSVDRSLHEREGGTFSLVVPEMMEDMVTMHFPEFGIEESEVAHPITPKYAQLIENLKKHFETGGKQIIFTEEKTQHNKLRRIIVHHLPLAVGKIGIINGEVASGDKLERISKAYNSGELKIVLANKKAEVGVNLQKGTTAIHHLTLPWTPASINQRNGRGVRQGNKVDSVAVYYYCGKGTFDSYRKDLLKAKSNWINDLLMGEAKTMENGDVTGLDELLDMLADNPEEAKRMRAERLAAQGAKREENFRIGLINKMQVLASIQKNIDSIDQKKATKRASLEDQRDAARRSVAKYEAQSSDAALSEDERAKAKDKLTSAKRRLSEAERDLSGLDEKFQKFREKQESLKKMNVALLRQAEREGRLPFDAALIDRPGDIVVSMSGNLFAVGDMLEFKRDGGIRKITAVDPLQKTVTIVPITGYGSERTIGVIEIPEHTKVSYSESELAIKKLLSEVLTYAQIRSSGIDKDMFLNHINEIRIRWSAGAVIRIGGELDVVWEGAYSAVPPEGAVPVWPEPENESFKKAVLTRYLERVRSGKSPFCTLLEGLFGENYQELAQEYGQRGTDAEILEKCSILWEEYKKDNKLDTATSIARAFREQTYSITRRVLDPICEIYDNARDIERVFKDFFRGTQERAQQEAAEEQREAERAANEKLREDPRYKEVPADIAAQFSALGISIRVNREETYIPGFKGRRGVTHEPFSRWFFQDSAGVGGTLYRMKDLLKSRYDAKFTKDWREHSGAWWHVSSLTDLQEIYELLA